MQVALQSPGTSADTSCSEPLNPRTLARHSDLLIVRVGFSDNAGGDGVTFYLSCDDVIAMKRDPSISFKAQSAIGDLVRLKDQYDRILRAQIVAMTTISSQCSEFTLGVETGQIADIDLAVWLSAYIARYPAGGTAARNFDTKLDITTSKPNTNTKHHAITGPLA